ncbi:MAG: HD domain-containing protein [Planctomycetaceae bacterium]|jgi:HD superfamily phosphohydrolase|nr:HD domain-containing protein [Planctomycetaceae bacterium]
MLTIPEITGLDSYIALIRIPPELTVPLTDRVRRIIDTAAFRRLAKITQVGLVSLVYPAARHTRFEHSLGVYRLALLFLKRLAHISRFAGIIDRHSAEMFIVTALLHDIGHFPYCHLIEDIRIPGIPGHEELAARYILNGEIADILRKDWHTEPGEVVELLTAPANLLSSILSGPIDIDKLDYLFRDSLHTGVPYGRNLDQERLIGSLCVNEAGNGLAITEKGKTAAELMIFARYVMFSEVYWHHSVRSATAMLQRLFAELYQQGKIDIDRFFVSAEEEAVSLLRRTAQGTPLEKLAEGLFGAKRVLYKRTAQFSILEEPQRYYELAGKPYPYLCAEADKLSAKSGEAFSVLIDAPPVQKEIEIKIDVYFPKRNCYVPLENISPVIRAMAKDQFDDYAKRVRIFRG